MGNPQSEAAMQGNDTVSGETEVEKMEVEEVGSETDVLETSETPVWSEDAATSDDPVIEEAEPEPLAAEEQTEESEDAPKDEQKADEPEADEEKPRRRRNRISARDRIQQALRRQREAELRAQQAEAELAALKKGGEDEPGEEAEPRPKLEDFDEEDEYIEAVTNWALNKRIAQEEADEAPTPEQVQLATARQTLVEAGRELYDDFDQVALAGNVRISPELGAHLLHHPQGADMAYYLGKNPEVAAEKDAEIRSALDAYPDNDPRKPAIAEYVSAQALADLETRVLELTGELETESTNVAPRAEPTETPAPTPQRRVSAAPEPVRPVNTGTGAPSAKSPEDMDQREYERMRRQQMAERRQGGLQ